MISGIPELPISFRELGEYGTDVSVWDPLADKDDVQDEYSLRLIDEPDSQMPYDAVIVAVRHDEIVRNYGLERLKSLCRKDFPILMDVKGIFDRSSACKAGFSYWRL